MERVKKDKLWSKDFTILFIANIVAMVGFQMLNPNMAEYASNIGASPATLGAVTAIFAMAALLIRPFSGKVADRLDCKKAAIFSLLGTTLAMAIYTLSSNYGMLLAARFIHGLFFGLYTTLTMAMASRVLPDSRMGSGIGIFGLGIVISMSLGPNVGISIVDSFNFNYLFIAAAITPLLSAFLLLFISKQEPVVRKGDEKNSNEPFWRDFFAPEAIGPATIGLLNAMAMGAINTFIVLHGRNKGVEGIGVFFTVNAVIVIAVRPFFSYFMDRVQVKRILYPCSLFIIASVLVIGIADTLPMFLLGSILFGIGNSGAQPALQTMSLRAVGFERRGAASGTYYIGLDLGNTVGPLVMSMVSGVYGYSAAYMSMAVPVALGILVTFLTTRKSKTDMARAES